MFLGIEHTAIATADPEKLAQWYVERLGFKINYFSPASKTTFVRAPNGSMIEIITAEGDRPATGLRTPGVRHLAIAVDDFAAAYESLKAAGVKFLTAPEINPTGNSVVFFADPEGNVLHLIQRAQPLP